MTEREQFEAWWPSVGQTIGKAAAWEAWQARATPKVPEGMAIVPVEPTEEMLKAGVSVALSTSIHGQGGWNGYLLKLYAAMLSAAKEQS